MRLKEIAISIDPSSSVPLFLQIKEGIVHAIREGRLAPGTSLPGSRALSDHLNVSRTTVNAAFDMLRVHGWIESRSGSGSYVVDKPPIEPSCQRPEKQVAKKDSSAFNQPVQSNLAHDRSEKGYSVSLATPDSRLFPQDEMGRAYHRALHRKPDELLNLGNPQGDDDLRAALSLFLGERRGISVSPEMILVTRGTRMSLNLLAQGLLKPGDLVAIEDPGNPEVWESVRAVNARLLAIPVDSNGLVVDALEKRLHEERIRFCYVSPRYQIPTNVELSQERRQHLLRLAREHRFAIVEEDSEADITYDKQSTPPLAASDEKGTVIYLNSFTHILASGIHLGFLTGPKAVVDRLTKIRHRVDWQGDQILERAVAKLLEEGKILGHLLRTRSVYCERRDMVYQYLIDHFQPHFTVDMPQGGLSFWIKVNPSLDILRWCKKCGEKGVRILPGSAFTLDGTATPFFRLCFAAFNSTEMKEILECMRQMLPLGLPKEPFR